MAAQEQNLIARSIEAGVYHSHQGTSCKLCPDGYPRHSIRKYDVSWDSYSMAGA